MANPEHLAILKQGVKVWNQWRREYPAVSPDLSAVNLIKVALSGADLHSSNLSDGMLGQVNLERANAKNALFHRTNLRGANLSGADLEGADLLFANCRAAYLEDANLSDSDLEGTTRVSAGGFTDFVLGREFQRIQWERSGE